MRDFHDAKAMARTLRDGLARRGHGITNSQSLELIAEAFGVADWNTLAAMIHNKEIDRPRGAPSPAASKVESRPALPFSPDFAATMQRARAYANQRRHEYSTLEHLLLALTDDAETASVMRACNVDLRVLKEKLIDYLDTGLERLVIDGGTICVPTVAFQRVVSLRAGFYAEEIRSSSITGTCALLSIFAETLSPAARLLTEQGMTHHQVFEHFRRTMGGGASE